MGLRFKNHAGVTLPVLYWWRKEESEFTPDEQILIQEFVQLKTYEALAERRQCSSRTIQRQLAPLFAKINAKDRQAALEIFQTEKGVE